MDTDLPRLDDSPAGVFTPTTWMCCRREVSEGWWRPQHQHQTHHHHHTPRSKHLQPQDSTSAASKPEVLHLPSCSTRWVSNKEMHPFGPTCYGTDDHSRMGRHSRRNTVNSITITRVCSRRQNRNRRWNLLTVAVMVLMMAGLGSGSELPDRECCDSAPPPPPHYLTVTSTSTTSTPRPPTHGKSAVNHHHASVGLNCN